MSYRALILVAIAIALIAGAAEIVLRLYPDLRPSRTQDQIKALQASNVSADWFVADEELGFLGAPARRQMVTTPDYQFLSENDSQGFPNREPWPRHADIVFLGDSLIIGTGVGIDKQFTTLLANRYPDIRIVNLGLPGASPQQQLGIFRRYGRTLAPRLVVATLYVASDVDNAVHYQGWLKSGKQQNYNEYRLSYGIKQGKAAESNQPLGERIWSETKKKLRRLAIVEELKYIVRVWWKGQVDEIRYPDGTQALLSIRAQGALAGGLNQDAYEGIEDSFFGALEELDREVQSHNARLVVLLIPSKEETFAYQSSYPDVLNTIKQVRARLGAMGLTFIDVYQRIRTAAEARNPYFSRDIHLNAFGNELVADELAQWLATSGAARSLGDRRGKLEATQR
jgi:hypothetical protein